MVYYNSLPFYHFIFQTAGAQNFTISPHPHHYWLFSVLSVLIVAILIGWGKVIFHYNFDLKFPNN